MRALTPTREQADAVAKMAAEPTKAALNCSELGAGKTLQAVELAKALGATTVLVVAPLGVQSNWIRTFQRQGINLPLRFIKTDTDGFEQLRKREPGVYLVGREYYYLSGSSSPETIDGTRTRTAKYNWAKVYPDLHIVDESHSAQNRWGLMARTLMHTPAKYRLAMSGTPQGSKFDGIWSITRWLWRTHVDRSKKRWEAEWCDTERIVIGRDENNELKWVTKIVGEKTPGKYLNSLPCVIQLKTPTVPYKHYDGMVTLTPEMRRVWNEMEKDSIAWLENNPTVAKLPIEKRIRLRQMTLALPTLNETDEVSFEPDAPSVKIDAALKIQARHPGEKILFLTDSAKFARIAAPRLGAVLYAGEVSKKDRAALVDAFGSTGDPQYMVATYQSIAEGVDGLQRNCHIEVRFNVVDSPVLAEQVSGRLNRVGQTAEEIIRYNLIARDTLDDVHADRLEANLLMRRKELRL